MRTTAWCKAFPRFVITSYSIHYTKLYEERLEKRLRELEFLQRGASAPLVTAGPVLDAEDVEDLDEAPDNEVEAAEKAVEVVIEDLKKLSKPCQNKTEIRNNFV